jgi:hypothetical protein
VLLGPRLPGWRELPALGLALAPHPLRAAVIARRRKVFRTFGWITPTARRRIALAFASWESRDPWRWDVALRTWWWRSRALQCNRAGKRVLGRAENVEMVHPLCEPGVLTAVARTWGRAGPTDRQSALRHVGGELLPESVLRRSDKPWFDRAFWTSHARGVARAWDGEGVDPALVNAGGLRREWNRDPATPHVYTLLQSAWLASASRKMPEQQLEARGERIEAPGAA